MKRLVYILVILSMALNAYHAKGQNCPATPTYLNQSGTFDLTSGRTIVLNSGGTFNITVQNTFSSTSSICVLNGSTLNLSFLNVNTIQKGGNIYVDKTSKLSFTGSNINNFPLVINNAGTVTQSALLTFSDGATINNSGTYNITAVATLNSGAVSITNSGTFNVASAMSINTGTFSIVNTSTGTTTFSSSLTLSNTTITNAGTMNFEGAVILNASDVVTNNAYMNLQNVFTGSLVINAATVKNNGVMTVQGSFLINSGGVLNNTCTIKSNGAFTNNGSVNNSGLILLNTSSFLGLFLNQGPFVNTASGFVQGTTFTNNSSITGGGNFYFTGITTNQGTFAGSSSSRINFFDVSTPLFDQYFDVQTSTPSFTTKNAVAANTATTFTSCVDVNTPTITVQPSSPVLCTVTSTSASFNVTATSVVAPAYQWYKNGNAISNATAASYLASGLTLDDTATVFTVRVTNSVGTSISANASVKYLILSQPTIANAYLATGNAASFTGLKTSGALSFQWQRNGSNISGATSSAYSIPVVNYADSGRYKALVTYNGGSCTTDSVTLKTSIILYSKATGNLNLPATWGVVTDGSGSTPVDFTRDEHTFVLANRTNGETAGNLTIAGKLDVANSVVLISPNTTLTAGRVVRSANTGTLSATPTTSLIITGIATTAYSGSSDLYFAKTGNTIKNLTTSAHTVTLHSKLNITSGSAYGVLQVNSGTFNTSDSLTLKSDSLGTAGIARSLGTISGKVTIERFIHARRAWRFIGAPISSVNAPSIHVAWQENAANSKDNPAPGYGTHITGLGGTEANGFDLNPQSSSSMKYPVNNSSTFAVVTNTNTTSVTQYPAYMLFIRGNRSYNISSTSNNVTPLTTTLRVTGNVNQGTQAAKTINAKGYTTVSNPYAAPVNFTKILSASTNLKKLIWVWDPTLAGTSGVGAWVVLDGTSGTYKTTPASTYVTSVLQAGQGFLVQAADTTKAGSLIVNEDAKDFSVSTTNADRVAGSTDASLEVNLKVFDTDGTTATADGVLYHFGNGATASKMPNMAENLSIRNGNSQYSIASRSLPAAGDSLTLNISNVKKTSYQLEIVPSALKNVSLALYDKYLNTLTPVSATEATRITFTVSDEAASYDASRFTIVTSQLKVAASLTNVADNAAGNSKLSIYPNPLTGTAFTATLSNIAAGSYTLSVVNGNGITLFTKTIAHSGGTASQTVVLNNKLAAGMYYLTLSAAGKTISTVAVAAQ